MPKRSEYQEWRNKLFVLSNKAPKLNSKRLTYCVERIGFKIRKAIQESYDEFFWYPQRVVKR